MNINLQIPVNPLGYGVAGIHIAEELINAGADIRIQSIGQSDVSLVSKNFIQALEKNVTHHEPSWPLVKIWHQHSLIERIGKGKYYGFPIFELDTFTQREKYNLKVPDELIVCSNWAKDIVENQIQAKCHVVPLGVDRSVFRPIERSKDDKYKFFTIGKLEYRKGHDFIVKCFNKAFDPKDNVELDMMVHNPFLSRDIMQEWYSNFKNSKLGTKINICHPVETHKEVADFINDHDCGLFPSRAEGWNLELLESMSCGKPVIATDYSAHKEYIHNTNCYKINIYDKEKAYDKMGGMWFNGQGSWAELDYEQEDQMVEHMRYCYNNIYHNEEGEKTAKKFTWTNSVQKLLETL